MGGFNGYAGACALAFIMIPIVARTTEEMLRLVPNSYRDASIALGRDEGPHDFAGRAAGGEREHHHGHHVGGGARGGRNGAAVVYGAGFAVVDARSRRSRSRR